jgi:hypothetical protein
MAQIIKHRRGSIANLKGTTTRNGELIIASGSVNDLQGPFVFIGSPNSIDEGTAGAFNVVSKIYQGNSAPTLSAGTYGSTLDGTPFYAATDKSLYVLQNSNIGNNKLDLTGNIEGNTISGVTINNLQSTNVTASFVSGAFIGDATGLYNIPATGVTGLNLSKIYSGSVQVTTDSVTGDVDVYATNNVNITGSANVNVFGSNSVLLDMSDYSADFYLESSYAEMYAGNEVYINSNNYLYVEINGGESGMYMDSGSVQLYTYTGDISINAYNDGIDGAYSVNISGSNNVNITGSNSVNLFTSGSVNFVYTNSEDYYYQEVGDVEISSTGFVGIYAGTGSTLELYSNAGEAYFEVDNNINGGTNYIYTDTFGAGFYTYDTGSEIEHLVVLDNTGSFWISGSNVNVTDGNLQVNGSTSLTGAFVVSSGSATFDQGLVAENSNMLLTSGSNLIIQDSGNLQVAGDASISGALYVSGNIYQTGSFYTQGDITLLGNINIGNNLTGDTVNFNAEISSSLIPSGSAIFDLGSPTNYWNNIYGDYAHFNTITLDTIAFSGLTEGRVLLAGPSGSIVDSGSLTYGYNGDYGDYTLEAPIIRASNDGNGTNFLIGNDMWLGDINVSNGTRFMGYEDNNIAKIYLGSNSVNDYLESNYSNVRLNSNNDLNLYSGNDVNITGSNNIHIMGSNSVGVGQTDNSGYFYSEANYAEVYGNYEIELYSNSEVLIYANSGSVNIYSYSGGTLNLNNDGGEGDIFALNGSNNIHLNGNQSISGSIYQTASQTINSDKIVGVSNTLNIIDLNDIAAGNLGLFSNNNVNVSGSYIYISGSNEIRIGQLDNSGYFYTSENYAEIFGNTGLDVFSNSGSLWVYNNNGEVAISSYSGGTLNLNNDGGEGDIFALNGSNNIHLNGNQSISGSIYQVASQTINSDKIVGVSNPNNIVDLNDIAAGNLGLFSNNNVNVSGSNIYISGSSSVTVGQLDNSAYLYTDPTYVELYASGENYIYGNSIYAEAGTYMQLYVDNGNVQISSYSGGTLNLNNDGDTGNVYVGHGTNDFYVTSYSAFISGSNQVQVGQTDQTGYFYSEANYAEIYSATEVDVISDGYMNIYTNDGDLWLYTDNGSGDIHISSYSGKTTNINTDGGEGDVYVLNGANELHIYGATAVTGAFTVSSGSVTTLGGDLFVSGNLTVLGSQTNVNLESHTVNIGDNIILVNAYSPFQRYAGIAGYDSGSTGASGSLLWDSLNNYWNFVTNDGSSSKMIGTTAAALGSEVSLTSGTFPIATGDDTIGNSLLTYSGTTLAYNTNKFTVDSTSGNVYIYGNVTMNGVGGTDAGSLTSQVVFRNSSDILGYVDTTDTLATTTQLLGYDGSDGTLKFSSVIDGGSY